MIAVTWKFKSQADKEKLIKIWTPLAEYVAKHEPNTLAYEMSFSEDDPLKVFLYERSGCHLLHPASSFLLNPFFMCSAMQQGKQGRLSGSTSVALFALIVAKKATTSPTCSSYRQSHHEFSI